MEVKIIGQMDNTVDHTFESANRVYDIYGISPTVNTCGGGWIATEDYRDCKAYQKQGNRNDVKLTRLGNFYNPKWNTGLPGNVWDKYGICPTLTTMQGGGREPCIIEIKEISGNDYRQIKS